MTPKASGQQASARKAGAWLALSALFALIAHAQPTITATGPASVTAGQTATLTVSLSGSAGQNIAGVQWSQGLAPGLTLGTPVASAPIVALGDAAYCGAAICLVVGSLAVMADGALATVPILVSATAVPGLTPLPLTGLLAATPAGLNVPGVVSGAPYSLRVLSRCDLNGDGTVNVVDVMVAVNAVLGVGSCPVSGGCSLETILYVISAAAGNACKV